MAPRKKKKKIIKTKKALNNRKNLVVQKKLDVDFTKILKAPFLFINIVIDNVIKLFKSLLSQFYVLIKKLFNFLAGVKEAFFSIIFGLLAGSIGAVIIFSYLALSFEGQNIEYETKIIESEKEISLLKEKIENNKVILNKYTDLIKELNIKLEDNQEVTANNSSIVNKYNEKTDELFEITNKTNERILLNEKNNNSKILELEKKIYNTSKLLLSSSKSELSEQLYLAKSLIDRLKSGVPYNPQLVALGQEGLNPALLRFAKGGAPTLSDLAARLSVRAGELRDSIKTKGDETWKDNLKDEFSKLIKIKPTNIADVEGMEGVLLRAEQAISQGNLEKAILEIDSLEEESRGVLNAWLKEAKARKDASIAAENLLARITAALRTKN